MEKCKQLCQTGTARNQELQKQLSEALRAKSVLEQRFHTLSSNYEELTRIMDEYKRENRKIRTELEKKSKESVLVEIEEKDGQLLSLRETITERDERVRLLEGRCSILEDEIRELTKTEKENKAVFSRQLHREQQNQRGELKVLKFCLIKCLYFLLLQLLSKHLLKQRQSWRR